MGKNGISSAMPAAVLLAALLLAGSGAVPFGKKAPVPDLPAAGMESLIPEQETLFTESPPVLPSFVREDAALTPAAPVLAEEGGAAQGTVYFKNQTDYTIDLPALLARPCPVRLGKEGVQVLVMHTHGTEAYAPSPGHTYTASGDYRTTDKSCNMLAVGQLVTDLLNERGIPTVHSEALNDYPAYNGSYSRALKDISAYAEQYPSLTLILDLHRDAIGTAGHYYKTSAEVEGQQTAQLMFVTGTDQGGLSHPGWRDNLTFQAMLHQRLNSRWPGLMRPMSIRTGRFNQHVRTGSMLVEVGACGNTLEEALAAARLFADELADMLLEDAE